MKKLVKSVIVIIIVAGSVSVSYLLFTGPRMYVQPNIRPFQAVMPPTPPGAVPVITSFEPLPSKEQSEKLINPLAKTAENCAKGKIYYGYYCAFCHGDKGDGFGPVGYSYVPVPADLRTEKIQSMTDGHLLYSMFAGTGHTPILRRIVPPQYRWYLTLYVRQLASDFQSAPSAPTESNSPPLNR